MDGGGLMDNAWQTVEARLARRARRTRGPGGLLPPDPTLPPGTDMLPQISHIVVLMMENHSFDNYFGMLGRGDALTTGPDLLPTATNPASDGENVRAHHASATAQLTGVPTQAWRPSHEQWADGTNQGFVRSAEAAAKQLGRADVDPSIAMAYWTGEDLPYYWALARTFPLADRWFSSCLGPTFPNRRFLIAGTANGLTSDNLANTFDRPENGTLFDLLERHRISWTNYHSVSHRSPLLKRGLGVHGLRASRWAARAAKRLAGDVRDASTEPKSFLQFTADAYPLGMLRYTRHVHSIDRFLADAAAGTLPSVSLVDPDFRTCSEENPQDIREGERFAARIINAVLGGKGWHHTLLIWVYDEHGGYFDHVPPPPAVEPDGQPPEAGGPWRYDRLGFRVPAVIVSPYARADYVSHVVHDHTSILKLIETKWNLPPLTSRDAQADNLLDSLDLTAPPAFAEPPVLPPPALGH
ncbi:MAG: Acid phosphatase [Acidimicrobiales bacterium]|nr:Acid phosphatase [Acidimicrobiales bacterium]